MPTAKIANLLETEIAQGWTAELITNAGGAAQTITVKATPGKVSRIIVNTGAINVTPYDGAVASWAALTSAAELNLSATPIQFSTDIRLLFSNNGNAWILYK